MNWIQPHFLNWEKIKETGNPVLIYANSLYGGDYYVSGKIVGNINNDPIHYLDIIEIMSKDQFIKIKYDDIEKVCILEY